MSATASTAMEKTLRIRASFIKLIRDKRITTRFALCHLIQAVKLQTHSHPERAPDELFGLPGMPCPSGAPVSGSISPVGLLLPLFPKRPPMLFSKPPLAPASFHSPR